MHIDAHTFIYICRRLHYQKSCCDFLHTFSLFLGLFCFNEWESVSLSVKWRRQTDKKKDKDGGRSDEHKEPERTDAVIKGKIVHVMRNCYRMWQCQWVRRVNSECFEILREQKGLMDGVSSGVIARLDKWLKAGCRCCDNQDCAVQSKGWCGGFYFEGITACGSAKELQHPIHSVVSVLISILWTHFESFSVFLLLVREVNNEDIEKHWKMQKRKSNELYFHVQHTEFGTSEFLLMW